MNFLILGTKEYPLGTNTDDPSPSGGMEIYVEGLVSELQTRSDITLITRRFSKTKSHEKIKHVEIWRVPWINGFVFRNPTFNLLAFIKSLSLDFDVVISHGEVANMFGLLLSKIKRRPIVMVNHGLASEQRQYNPLLRLGFKLIDKITYSKADAVITHSISKIPKGVKYNYVMPGFNKSKLKADNSLRMEYDIKGTVILFTGRLMKTKGVDFLIKSLPSLDKEYTCFIVGDGPERKSLEALSKRLKVNVIFTGFREDINRFLSIADVFVMPSLSESLNYSMIEAAYMKVPIIATDHGVFPKGSFIKIKKKDVTSITKSINKLGDTSVMTRTAFNFTQRFDWKVTANTYSKIIKSVLKESA